MSNREIIYQSLEIMENHLKSDLTLTDLADKLGYSLYYFVRLFKGVTGYSPMAYLNRRRVTSAYDELKRGDKKIIDLAMDYGFGTPESFSRAFNRQTGSNPVDVMKGKTLSADSFQPPLTGDILERARHQPFREPELVERPPLHLAGLSLYYTKEMPGDLSAPWQCLLENKGEIPDLLLPESYYQVQFWLPHLFNFEYYGREYKGPFDEDSISEIYIPVSL